MKEKQAEPFLCPFCGAPQKSTIPRGTTQIKCKYCGAVILVPTWMGSGTCWCTNHHEKVADGLCNDCGESFCTDCLSPYELERQGESGTLYLCSDCLKERYVKKANGYIFFGFVFLSAGIFQAAIMYYAPIVVIFSMAFVLL